MPFLELFDETLDINSTGNYELSLQVSEAGIAFCLLDSIRDKFVMIRSFEPDDGRVFSAERIGEIISKDDFLSKPFRKTTILLPSRKYTLVPSALFDAARKAEYYSLNFGDEEPENILYNNINDPDSFIVYASDKNIREVISAAFPTASVLHPLCHLLDKLSGPGRSSSGNNIHINCERDYFDLLVFRNNNLRLCNSFGYKSADDILYYSLNALSKLAEGREDTIYLSGRTERNDALYTGLNVYYRNIKFAGLPAKYNFSYVFGEISLHRFLNLFLSAG